MTIPVDPDSGRELTRADMMAGLGVGKSQLQNYAKAFEKVAGCEIPRRGPNRIYREWHLDVFRAAQALAPLTLLEAFTTVLTERDGDPVEIESTEAVEPSWDLEHSAATGEAPNEPLHPAGLSPDVLEQLRSSNYHLALEVLRVKVNVIDLEQQLKDLRAELKQEIYVRDVGMELVFKTSWSMRILGTWRSGVEWVSQLFRRA